MYYIYILILLTPNKKIQIKNLEIKLLKLVVNEVLQTDLGISKNEKKNNTDNQFVVCIELYINYFQISYLIHNFNSRRMRPKAIMH